MPLQTALMTHPPNPTRARHLKLLPMALPPMGPLSQVRLPPTWMFVASSALQAVANAVPQLCCCSWHQWWQRHGLAVMIGSSEHQYHCVRLHITIFTHGYAVVKHLLSAVKCDTPACILFLACKLWAGIGLSLVKQDCYWARLLAPVRML